MKILRGRKPILLIIFFSIILRLISLNQSFWLDEAAQAVLSAKPIFQVNYGADFQPPLYYILMHFWMKLGIREEWLLRLPSVFFGVSTVLLSYYFFKKLFDKKVGFMAAILLATAPYHIYFSQEFRMYSFFTFLMLLSWLFLWEKKWVWYGITILFSVFTHYFAFLAIISQFTYILLIKGERRRYALTLLISLLPFLFWLPTLQKQLQTVGNLISLWPKWNQVAGVSFLKFPFLFLAKTTVGMISPANKLFYAGIVFIISLILLFSVSRILYLVFSKNSKYSKYKILNTKYLLLFCYLFIPLILAWFSGLFVSANSPHRLIFVLPAFYGILVAGMLYIKEPFKLAKRSSEKIKVGLIVILILSNISFSLLYLLNSKYHRENWRDAVAYTDSRIGESSIVLSEYIGPWAPIAWYSQKPEKYLGASTQMYLTDESIKKRLDPYIFNTKYFILYTYLFELSDPQKKVENFLLNKNYHVTEEKDFRGVGIIKTFSLLP